MELEKTINLTSIKSSEQKERTLMKKTYLLLCHDDKSSFSLSLGGVKDLLLVELTLLVLL